MPRQGKHFRGAAPQADRPAAGPLRHDTASEQPASASDNPYADVERAGRHRRAEGSHVSAQDRAVGFAPVSSPRSRGAAARRGAGLHGAAGTRAAGPHGAAAAAGSHGAPAPRKRSNRLSNFLIILGVALLVVAGGMWGYAQLQYHAQDENNAKLAAYATVSDDPASDTGPQVDWDALKAINDDIVGWIQIPGTVVNYPVYQGESNDTYLRHTATGEYSVGGQIFMDYENARPGMVDRQTMIYGHHLDNGTMFAQVDAMADQADFDKVTTVWYATEQRTYELEPLFMYKTAATNTEARRITFSSDDDFHSYLQGLLAQATTKSAKADQAVTTVSRVLTLATCDYDNNFGYRNGRGLVVCAIKSEVETGAASGGAASSDAVTTQATVAQASAQATSERARRTSDDPATAVA